MEPISWNDFLVIALGCAVTIFICRSAPLFLLRGKELPGWLSNALTFIPPAAFAALIANDLLSPTMFEGGVWPGALPLVAALIVVPVAIKTKSLMGCIVVGVGAYGVLLLI